MSSICEFAGALPTELFHFATCDPGNQAFCKIPSKLHPSLFAPREQILKVWLGIFPRAGKALFGKSFDEGAFHSLHLVQMVTSPFSIVTDCYQLEILSDSLTMQLFKSSNSRLNRDKVYVNDPDLEQYRTSWFLKFHSTLECITMSEPEMYYPSNFTDIISSIGNEDTSASPVA